MTVQPRGGDGMAFVTEGVDHHDDTQVFRGNAGHAQRDVFRNRVILAIAGAVVEGDERRAPEVDLAVLHEVVHGANRQVDGAVDLAETGAAFALPAGIDDREEFQRGVGGAVVAIAVAERQLHPFVIELVLDAEPFGPQAAGIDRRGREPERLARIAR